MAYMLLSDFRTEVQSAIGDRGFTNSRLDRWINFGYLDLAGAIDFEELTDTAAFAGVIGQNNYPVPADARIVQLVINETDQRLLQFVDKSEFFRLERTVNAPPLKWTRVNDEILLNPTPDATDSFTIVYKKDPTRLINAADLIVLPDTWDAAVTILGTYHGLLAVGEEQRATQWFARAVNYIQSRITQEETFIRTPGLGLTYAVPGERAINALTEAQQAAGVGR